MRQIIGNLKTPAGTPLQSARIFFSALRSSPLGIPVGESGEFKTDANGDYDFEIEAGQYQISIDGAGPRRVLAADVTIVEGDPTDLMTLISALSAEPSELDELYNRLIEAADLSGSRINEVPNQFIVVPASTNRIIELGPQQSDGGDDITYEVFGSLNISVNGNIATYNSDTIGQEIMTVRAEDESGNFIEVLMIVNTVSLDDFVESTLSGVTVEL